MNKKRRTLQNEPEEGPLVAACTHCHRTIYTHEILGWAEESPTLYVFGIKGECQECQSIPTT